MQDRRLQEKNSLPVGIKWNFYMNGEIFIIGDIQFAFQAAHPCRYVSAAVSGLSSTRRMVSGCTFSEYFTEMESRLSSGSSNSARYVSVRCKSLLFSITSPVPDGSETIKVLPFPKDDSSPMLPPRFLANSPARERPCPFLHNICAGFDPACRIS